MAKAKKPSQAEVDNERGIEVSYVVGMMFGKRYKLLEKIAELEKRIEELEGEIRKIG